MAYVIEGGGTATRTKTRSAQSTPTVAPKPSGSATMTATPDYLLRPNFGADSGGMNTGVVAVPPPVVNTPSGPPPPPVLPNPTSAAPAAPGKPAGPNENASPVAQEASGSAFDANTLEQILVAMETKYGLSREQLLAEQGELGRTYRFLLANLERSREEELLRSQGQSISRGILRSGIHLRDQSKIQASYAEQAAQSAAEKAAREAAIAQEIARLEAELAAESVTTAAEFGSEGIEYKKERASTY